MNWDRKNDNLFFDFSEIRKKLIETPTKRAVIVSTEGHAFNNASKTTYAASFYFKFNLSSGRSKVALISSKSHFISAKVRKSKNNTTPRNELQGILLLTRLSNSLRQALQKIYDMELARSQQIQRSSRKASVVDEDLAVIWL